MAFRVEVAAGWRGGVAARCRPTCDGFQPTHLPIAPFPPQPGRQACGAGPGRTAFARRPHLAHFLARASSLFEVVVFTAGARVRGFV